MAFSGNQTTRLGPMAMPAMLTGDFSDRVADSGSDWAHYNQDLRHNDPSLRHLNATYQHNNPDLRHRG